MRTQDYALVTVTVLVLALAVVYATGLEVLLSGVAETFTSLHGR